MAKFRIIKKWNMIMIQRKYPIIGWFDLDEPYLSIEAAKEAIDSFNSKTEIICEY